MAILHMLFKNLFGPIALIGCVIVGTVPESAAAQDRAPVNYRQMVDRSVEFLRSRGQSTSGGFSEQAGPGITALVVAGLLAVDVPREDPMVAKGLEYLLSFRQPDGGFYPTGSNRTNYETCLTMLALARANGDGKYNDVLAKASGYVKNLQWDESESLKSDDLAYGGAGYGSRSRPDMSNTGFMIDALKSAGVGENDEAIQRALLFVSRCQNLESSANNSPFAALINDGGFFYTVAAGGESFAGKTENGGLRSYGSMTYVGLKSMIFAGVSKDDPRVQAAVKFLRANYSIENNPGMGPAGLYYYYHTMAKALDAFGENEFTAADGKHVWRNEMLSMMAKNQQPDGSWVNPETRWMEGDPNLVTGYALLTLSYLKAK